MPSQLPINIRKQKKTEVSIFDASSYRNFDEHKAIYKFDLPQVNVHGFIAIHNTNLGPAIGGTRMYPYDKQEDAIEDALKLSRAMTYKCAIANVPFGGGKAVIIAEPNMAQKRQVLVEYAQVINTLRGNFITGEDVGITEEEVQTMLKHSKYFVGRTGQAGDPSYFAALSVFYVMQTTAKLLWHDGDLSGKRIAIKGVGSLGSALLTKIIEAKAKAIIADIDPLAIAVAQKNILKYK